MRRHPPLHAHALRLFAGTFAGLLLACSGVAHPAGDADTFNRAVAEQHVLPAYERLAADTAALQQALQSDCADASTVRSAAQQRFAAAFLAWQGIQHLRFGPIQVLSRDYRFQLWPDKRGSVGKHLRLLLASADPARLAAHAFASDSVAVQGFSALERLLFEPPGAVDPAWQCRVMQAIGANLQRMAAQTLAEWRDGAEAHRLMFATATDGNAYYDSADELSARLLNNLHTQLERIAEQKIARPLGERPGAEQPKRAEAWRSGLSLAAIRENLAALQGLYRTGFAARLADRALDARIDAGFAEALALTDSLDRQPGDAFTQANDRPTLERLAAQVMALRGSVGGELAQALSLPLGFNSLDGD